MSKPDHSRVIHFAEAQAGIPGPSGQRSISLLRHGSLDVKLSRPLPPNEQTPHAQDEVYVVFRGRGVLLHDGKRDPFETGDLMFVAAGTEHRFEDFTEDLAVWFSSTAPLAARSRFEARAEMNAPTGLRSVGRLSPERRFMA